MSIKIEIDYSSDDSGDIILWAKGHLPIADFIKACEDSLLKWDGRVEPIVNSDIKHTYYRTVRASSETSIHDYARIESKPGRGAYAVTIFDKWLPQHI